VATITIKVGTVSAERQYPGNNKFSAAFKEFFLDQGLGQDTATEQQMLDECIKWFAKQVTAKAAQRHIQKKRGEAETEASGLYELEPPPPVTP
jgi:hypothetical protein